MEIKTSADLAVRPRIARRIDVVAHNTEFDTTWYRTTFGDADLMGLEPLEHFARFGAFLGRGVGPATPSLSDLPDLWRALTAPKVVSYCIPIMNRPDDIKGTLARNLEENRVYQDDIEFVLVFLDEDKNTHGWVRESFGQELRSGYLRLIVAPPLDGWHFCKAKNAHRQHATGRIFSSLDGDNFVTAAETEQLLTVDRDFGGHFIFHHFTGVWGDGSSGRVSMPIHLYQDLGYDETLMPRQFDEIDVILSALTRDPTLPLVRIASANHALSSRRTSEFIRDVGLTNSIVELEAPHRISPMNPKSGDYVRDDPLMGAMLKFNQSISFAKNARNNEQRERYHEQTLEARMDLLDAMDGARALSALFRSSGLEAGSLGIEPTDVCVIACVKNDDEFLARFYAHYAALGISAFLIVDDGSTTPVEATLPHDNVHVFRPKVGTFRTAKTLWMEGLVKAFIPDGAWVLTVDADELVDLPPDFETFASLADELDARGETLQPALLLDMVPGPETPAEALASIGEDFPEVFDHYLHRDDPIADDYAALEPIRWGFGPYAALSWMCDIRYHAFGTVDSLRKIPFFKPAAFRHMNQGFHTLHYSNGQSDPDHSIWNTDLLLTTRHYKLLKLFSAQARERTRSMVASMEDAQYHARTAQNISRIFSGTSQHERLVQQPLRQYQPGKSLGLRPRDWRVG